MSYEPQIGDDVWAKMRSFPPWPSLVIKPEKSRKGSRWIYFFGTNNYAWIEFKNIQPYDEYKSSFRNMSRTSTFKGAMASMEAFKIKKAEDPKFAEKFFKDLPILYPFKAGAPKKPVPQKRSMDAPAATPPAKKQRPKSLPAPPSALLDQSATEQSPSHSPTSHSPITANHADDKSFDLTTSSILYTNEIEALPPIFIKPDPSVVDLSKKNLKNKHIVASKASFGFMGLGIMGSSIVRNLIISGHRVNLWNRTPERCDEIKDQADLNNQSSLVDTYLTPTDIVQNSDIIFSCLADPHSAKKIVNGNCGVVHGADGPTSLEGKGYVEMTSIDPATSHDICSIITSRGGRYLEAQLQGSKAQADDGSLIILAAGDPQLFNDCKSCFTAMGKTAVYLGNTGFATKMNLYLNMALGISLAGFSEGMTLAERLGLSITDFMEIFNLTEATSSYLSSKGKQMIENRYRDTEEAVKYMQKDTKLCLDISDGLKQSVPVAAASNEVYKAAVRFSDSYDVSSIFNVMKNF